MAVNARSLSDFFLGVRAHVPQAPQTLIAYFLRETAQRFCRSTFIWQEECEFVHLQRNVRRYLLTPPSLSIIVRAMSAKIKLTASNGTITGATQANPVVIASAQHGLTSGSKVFIEGVVGMIELNDRTHTVGEIPDDDHFEVQDDGTGYNAYFSGGTWNNVSAYGNLPPQSDLVLDTTRPGWRIQDGRSGNGQNSIVPYNFFCEDTASVSLSFDPAEDVPNGLQVRCALKPEVNATLVPETLWTDWHQVVEAGAVGGLLEMPGKSWSDPIQAGLYLRLFADGIAEARGDRMSGNVHRSHAVRGSIGAYT